MNNRGRTLRQLLSADRLTLIMEAHNALVARICERNGFQALWASGLTLSSSMGLRDHNEATWTELLSIADLVVNATSLPVLFDGDSGQGNFNNVRRLVRTLSARGYAGVVIEDKTFPKMNSYIKHRHTLVAVEEFQGKLEAAKDAQLDHDFVVIARLEGFIAGDEPEAVAGRAHAYCDAGADGLFVHSRRADAADVAAFVRNWDQRAPLIVSPTSYPGVSFAELQSFGVSAAICANHAFRAAMRAVDLVTKQIRVCNSLSAVEGAIATLDELFELLDYKELDEASRRYERTTRCPSLSSEVACSGN